MTKTATPNSTTAMPDNQVKPPKAELNPKSQFMGAALSMSWQLAVVVLVPVIGGYKIDQHLNTLPAFTIIGFGLAMLGTFVVIKRALNQFSGDVSKTDGK